MLAFTNTEMTKDEFMANLRAQAQADEIVRGAGYKDGKGRLAGCSLNDYDHSRGPAIAGIPEEIWHLADAIHEGLRDEPHLFPLAFGEAINTGADLSKVHWKFLVWMLTDQKHGVKRFSGNPDWGVSAAINQVAALCARMAAGEPVTEGERVVARAGAWSAHSAAKDAALNASGDAAAWAATWAALYAADAARDAARAAAGGAAWAAGNAAWAAGAVSWAAEAATYIAMRDKLLELLREAKSLSQPKERHVMTDSTDRDAFINFLSSEGGSINREKAALYWDNNWKIAEIWKTSSRLAHLLFEEEEIADKSYSRKVVYDIVASALLQIINLKETPQEAAWRFVRALCSRHCQKNGS